MDLKLEKFDQERAESTQHVLSISGSKSESNRLLILQKLFSDLEIKNLSDSDDTEYLSNVLASKQKVLDIGHAGTAMRFGTAYFASQQGREVTLTGSERMKQRPIKILVDALNDLGADISYLEQEGYPPLLIKGTDIKGGKLDIDGSVSSQYLTALLLVGTQFEKGLQLHIHNLTSVPYLKMTTSVLQQLGADIEWRDYGENTVIQLSNMAHKLEKEVFQVESDWSSAGYWYSWVAMQNTNYTLSLKFYKDNSLQGDSKLAHLYDAFGVRSEISDNILTLLKVSKPTPEMLEYDFSDIPDQAQTVFATCLGLAVNARFTGLHTLKVKETDRIEAMKIVGSRFRESEIITTSNDLTMNVLEPNRFKKGVMVDTFNDHRMAMAFAPLCAKTSVVIKDAEVVTKSYHAFWDDLKRLGVVISER